MRKLAIALLLFGTVAIAPAQTDNSIKIPKTVNVAFNNLFSSITTVKWAVHNGRYKAHFTTNGNNLSVLIDKEGNILETGIGIKVTTLLEPIVSYLAYYYKGETIKSAEKVTKANGSSNYKVRLNKRYVYFGMAGNFVKEDHE
jgi:hypothetical protein